MENGQRKGGKKTKERKKMRVKAKEGNRREEKETK